MKTMRHNEEQIAFASKVAQTGTPVAKVIRRLEVSGQTLYRWKQVSDACVLTASACPS
jgi:transposase